MVLMVKFVNNHFFMECKAEVVSVVTFIRYDHIHRLWYVTTSGTPQHTLCHYIMPYIGIYLMYINGEKKFNDERQPGQRLLTGTGKACTRLIGLQFVNGFSKSTKRALKCRERSTIYTRCPLWSTHRLFIV